MMDGVPLSDDVVLMLLTFTVVYVVFTYFGDGASFMSRFKNKRGREAIRLQTLSIFWQRCVGAVLLGVIPAIVAALFFENGLSGLGLALPSEPKYGLGFVALVAVVIWPAVFLSMKKPKSWDDYPQIRAPVWDTRLYVLNALTWFVYLIGYEFLFRGFLLMSLTAWTSMWPAIAITTALYVLAHLQKPAAETLGCIPMGIVFAMAALTSQSIWVPVIMHTMIAVASDVFVTRANPRVTVN